MVTDREIPDWTDASEQGLRVWWREMAAKGFAFHPDDPPETIVTVCDGDPVFDLAACRKLKSIVRAMLGLYGDKTYQVGHEVIMMKLGWIPSPSGDWVHAADNSSD